MFISVVITILSIGAAGGFIAGLVHAYPGIIANHYLQYGMYRLAALMLKPHLNEWIIFSITTGLLISAALIIGKLIWKYFLSEVITINIPDRYQLKIFWKSIVLVKKCLMPTALAAVLVVVALNSGLAILSRIKPQGPNVIMIVVDSLRKDHMGLYGYTRDTTPHIDRFSQDALVFQQAVTPSPWTAPAIASLFSCLYPSVHNVVGLGHELIHKRPRQHLLDYRVTTFAEILKEKGYRTGGFVANHVWVSRNNQYDQGFDVFHPIDISAFKPRAPELNKKALAWIHQNKSRPFFAYLHYMDTHEPYTPPEPYNLLFKSDAARPISNPEIAHNKSGHFFYETGGDDLNHYIDQYDGEISYVDHFIGRLLEELKEHGLTENTILIITSDHGESFFEHGYGSHGFTVYNPEIDIPLIVKFPKSVKLPDIQDHNLELMDMPATILAILNYSFPYPVSGINLLNTPDDSRAVFSEEMAEEYKGAPKIAMIKNGFKAIFRPQQQKVTELYNAATDKSETTNLVSRHPDMAKKFAEEILSAQANRLRIKKELGLKTASKEIQDPGKINQLKALGYIQ